MNHAVSEQLSIDIRTAEDGDAYQWLDLLELLASERNGVGVEPGFDADDRKRKFLDLVTDEYSLSLVANSSGRLVGTLDIVVKESGGSGYLGMMVHPDFRHQGIGRQLLEASVAWARHSKLSKVTLHVWPHNTAAIRLYEHCGFQHEGRAIREYRRQSGELWDSLAMGLILDTISPDSSLPDASDLPLIAQRTDGSDMMRKNAPTA